jgi:transcriptional regulator with XRE-family HTH domain
MIDRDSLHGIIGANIRKIRLEKDLNQENLAQGIELTRSSIAQIENGKQAVTIYSLYRIAEALKTSLEKILPSINSLQNDIFDEYSQNRFVEKKEISDLLERKQKEVVTNE